MPDRSNQGERIISYRSVINQRFVEIQCFVDEFSGPAKVGQCAFWNGGAGPFAQGDAGQFDHRRIILPITGGQGRLVGFRIEL